MGISISSSPSFQVADASMLNTPPLKPMGYNMADGLSVTGTSADRQLAVFNRSGDLKQVVQNVVSETAEGVRSEIAAKYRALADR